MPDRGLPTTRTDAYRRTARRLRGRWSGRPLRLHRELRELAGRHDSTPGPVQPPIPHRPCGAFAAEVETRLEGPVLRQAQRRRLFGIARRLGIGRFEANLIIAAVQHERRAAGAAGVIDPPPDAPSRWPQLLCGALAVGVQALIGWGVWFVFGA